MKVKVLKPFVDLTDGIDRKAGEVFDCPEARFAEIKAKLPEWVEIAEPKKTTAKKNSK